MRALIIDVLHHFVDGALANPNADVDAEEALAYLEAMYGARLTTVDELVGVATAGAAR